MRRRTTDQESPRKTKPQAGESLATRTTATPPPIPCMEEPIDRSRMSAEERHRLAELFADLLWADLARHPPEWMAPSRARELFGTVGVGSQDERSPKVGRKAAKKDRER